MLILLSSLGSKRPAKYRRNSNLPSAVLRDLLISIVKREQPRPRGTYAWYAGMRELSSAFLAATEKAFALSLPLQFSHLAPLTPSRPRHPLSPIHLLLFILLSPLPDFHNSDSHDEKGDEE